MHFKTISKNQIKMKKSISFLCFLILSLSSYTYSQSLKSDKPPLSLNLPDTHINGTKLKLKADLEELCYNQRFKTVILRWVVSYYADSFGRYGRPIILPGITNYTKTTKADNTVMVDSLTGEILEKDSSGNYPEGKTPMGQYDWFYNVGEYMEINVHDMILDFGLKAKEWDKPF